jgi:hypothetical protein
MDQYRLINLNGLAFCAHVTPLWFVSTRVSILTLVPSSAQMCVPEEAEMVLSVDDNAHYWQQHPHSSSATSQMSGTRTRAIKTLEMEDLCRIALKKAPLSDVVVQRHSSARCVVAGRYGWARIQPFPKPVVPEPFDSYTRPSLGTIWEWVQLATARSHERAEGRRHPE